MFTFLALFCFAESAVIFAYYWQKQKKHAGTVPLSDSGWDSSTRATTHYKEESTAENTITSNTGRQNRRSIDLSEWQAYADRKLSAVGERLRQHAAMIPGHLWRRTPPRRDAKGQGTILCEESSSDIYPSDGNSTVGSRKRLTKSKSNLGSFHKSVQLYL